MLMLSTTGRVTSHPSLRRLFGNCGQFSQEFLIKAFKVGWVGGDCIE